MQDFWLGIVQDAKAKSIAEIVAVFFAVASVLYSKKENILVYPTGIISVLIYIYICLIAGIYADMVIQVFYFIMSVYGWYNWLAKRDGKKMIIAFSSVQEKIISIFSAAVLWVMFYFVLIRYTDSTVPIIDSFTTALCFVGMWLMVWKRIENWIFFIVANIVSIPLYWHKELYLTALLFIFLTVVAVLGYFAWKKKLQPG